MVLLHSIRPVELSVRATQLTYGSGIGVNARTEGKPRVEGNILAVAVLHARIPEGFSPFPMGVMGVVGYEVKKCLK